MKFLKKKYINPESFSNDDVDKLLEELSIYRIELEQQNNELRSYQQELEIAKERFVDLFEKAPVGYIIFDTKFVIQQSNNTIARLLISDKRSIEGAVFTKFVQPEFQDIFYLTFRDKNKSNLQCDLKLKKSTNQSFYARLIGSVENTGNENNEMLRVAVIDISIEKDLELRLIEETAKSKESERLKSVFLANMSHEIRTPLNGIIGFSSLLTEGNVENDDVKNYAEIVYKSGRRLHDLVTNILELSKIESNTMKLTKETFSPYQLIKESVEMFWFKAKDKNIDIQIHVNDFDKKITLYSDKIRIGQILSNLINNALKFSLKGSILVGFSVQKFHIEFFVKDNGIGISTECLAHIFEQYFQVNSINSSSDEGAGLGLAISNGLARLLGGELYANSILNKGSEFYFRLPLK